MSSGFTLQDAFDQSVKLWLDVETAHAPGCPLERATTEEGRLMRLALAVLRGSDAGARALLAGGLERYGAA